MLHTCRLLGRLDRGVDSALLRKVHSAFRFWVRDLISDFGFEIQSLVFRVLGCRWGEQKGAKGSERYSVHTGDTIRRFDRGGFALLTKRQQKVARSSRRCQNVAKGGRR